MGTGIYFILDADARSEHTLGPGPPRLLIHHGDQATASFTLPFQHDDGVTFLNELIAVCGQLREHLNEQHKLLQTSM